MSRLALLTDDDGALEQENRWAVESNLPIKFWDELGVVAPPDGLVRCLLGVKSLALIYGDPGSGKTFLATDLSLHIAMGWDWFGRKVAPGAVLYVACEGEAGFNNRIAGARHRHALPAEVPFAVVPAAVNLGPGGEDARRIVAAAKATEAKTGQKVKLIVVDTLARAMGSGDENTSHDMGAFIRGCDLIRSETGATVLVIHHRGKSQSAGARGSSALLGAVDTAIEVGLRGDSRVARVVKQKDGESGAVLDFQLATIVVGNDEEGTPITTCIVVPASAPYPATQVRRRDLKGNAAVILQALKRALAEFGENAPANNQIPQGTRVVSTELWRQHAYKLMSESKPEARQRAFKRGYDALLSDHFVCVWGADAWIP